MSAVLLLLLSIVLSTLINLIFRLFTSLKINRMNAIVINYFVCFIVGWTISADKDVIGNMSEEWFIYAFGLGTFFTLIFYLMATTIHTMGISVNAVASKMAVVIPLVYAFFFLNENSNIWFTTGIVLSLCSIYLISVKKHLNLKRHYILYPIAVFLGSGFIDLSLKLLEQNYGQTTNLSTISYSIFLGAFATGTLVWIYKGFKGKLQLRRKEVLGGTALGLFNFFSIYILLEALAAFTDKSSLVFSINNISIVLLSTLLSILFFKEQLDSKNRWGLVLAIISIVIITYAQG